MNKSFKKIAILGATGYIGKSLIYTLSKEKNFHLFLFARSKKRLTDFLNEQKIKTNFEIKKFSELEKNEYNVIINCIGIGDPKKMKESGFKLLEITEKFDKLLLSYLEKNKDTIYINLSSGAVYGKDIEKPVNEKSVLTIDVNNIDQGDCYTITKINSEAKHRTLTHLNIVDIRVFSFFSRFIKLDNSGFLMSHLINAINNKSLFTAIPDDFKRDYVSSEDLTQLIKLIMNRGKINDFVDLYSRNTISFFDLLGHFEKKYGLKYAIKSDPNLISPTGSKNAYYSINKKAHLLGYTPKLDSLTCVEKEMSYLIKKRSNAS